MSTPAPQVHQGRDGETQLYKLLNELRRYGYVAPGLSWTIAQENIAAFKCVARDPSTENVVLARADGTNYAVGVIEVAVNVGELAKVVHVGIVLNAVSGRTAGDVCWVGTDGSLVFAPPGAGYVETIAVCLNATDIFVTVGAVGGGGGAPASLTDTYVGYGSPVNLLTGSEGLRYFSTLGQFAAGTGIGTPMQANLNALFQRSIPGGLNAVNVVNTSSNGISSLRAALNPTPIGNNINISFIGSTVTPSELLQPYATVLESSNDAAADMLLINAVGDTVVATDYFYANEVLRFKRNKDVLFGRGIAGAATGGFPFLPCTNGPPTGVPTNYYGGTELRPLCLDRTNRRLYMYDYALAAWLPIGQYTGGSGIGFLKTDNAGIWTVDTASYVPTTRTVQGTTPILIAGDTAAHDLSANRVWSHANTAVTPASYTYASITVDAMGHLTAASNGTTPVPATRTVQGTLPIQIDGDNAAHDLSANRTWSITDFVASGASHARGAVPDPGVTGGNDKFLCEDATWKRPAALLATFPFTIMINLSADGLVDDPYWLAPANADGAQDSDALDERGWPFAGTLPAASLSFYVKCLDGDGYAVDSGVWDWDFELLKNGVTSMATVTITSGGSGSQIANEDVAGAFNPGDHVGVRVLGSQVSGTSTTGSLFAFVSVSLFR